MLKAFFFGGGTPSLLNATIVNAIISKLKSVFIVDKKAEISLEVNPDSVESKEKVKDYLSAGLNRISLGVQTFDDNLLQTIGRVHTKKQAIEAYNHIRDANCRNVNIDLIWGLPKQNLKSWLQTVNELILLQPEHVSSYSLTIEEDTPFALEFGYTLDDDYDENSNIKSNSLLPSEKDLSLMYTRAAELFQENGYLQYEISNYSKMGYQCRHNLGYWEGVDYIGFGPAATSTIEGIRFSNPSHIEEWQKVVENPEISADREILSLQDRVIELIMLRLRTTKGLRVKDVYELSGRDFLKDNKELIHALHKNGLVRILDGYFSLTQQGFMVSNAILRHLFENTRRCLALSKND